MVVLMLVAGSLYLAYVFSYLYLWTVSPNVWAPVGSPMPPDIAWPGGSALLLLMSVAAFIGAGRLLPAPQSRNIWAPVLLAAGGICLAGAVAVEAIGHWQSGLRPTESSYAAMVYMASLLTGEIAFAIIIMTGFALARYFTGKLDRQRRVTFENTAVPTYYAAALWQSDTISLRLTLRAAWALRAFLRPICSSTSRSLTIDRESCI